MYFFFLPRSLQVPLVWGENSSSQRTQQGKQQRAQQGKQQRQRRAAAVACSSSLSSSVRQTSNGKL
jgi:hypothetical protein